MATETHAGQPPGSEDDPDLGRRRGSSAQVESTTSPVDLLAEGNAHQLAGRLQEAAECFALAIDVATTLNSGAVLTAGLRRLGIVHHLRGETATGIHYCERSRTLAIELAETALAADATMALANMACEQGRMDDARDLYQAALQLSPDRPDLVARIEQNLGVVESIQGNLFAALAHYYRALKACEATRDLIGRAKAHHNIGMIYADQKAWDQATKSYDQATSLARQGGDYHLQGLCLLNRAEVDLAHGRYDAVRGQAEAALAIFDRLGARADMAGAFRMLGIALRFQQRPALAESRLRSAMETAKSAGVPLTEAESCRDIASLFAETGRRREALSFIDRSLALFGNLGATLDIARLQEQRVMLSAA